MEFVYYKERLDYKTQVKLFKPLIPIGERTSSQLIKYLKNKFDTVEITFDDLPSYNYDMISSNARHYVGNMHLGIEIKNMHFRLFKIIENEKSIDYIDENESKYGNFLFFIIEEKTKYMCANSYRLLGEMSYIRGVSKKSYYDEDYIFKNLLSNLVMDYVEGDMFLFEKIIPQFLPDEK